MSMLQSSSVIKQTQLNYKAALYRWQ